MLIIGDFVVLLIIGHFVVLLITGDFAVLLHAGMSVKQALVYNMVSSVLCFLGMIIGVALGNISEASTWIFALAAGMFIYIALVDMVSTLLISADVRGTT